MVRRNIEVSIRHADETIEYAVKPDTPWITGILPVGRGPVQLVIDMPARSARLFFVSAVTALVFFLIAGVEWWLFSLVPNTAQGALTEHPFLFAAGLALVAFVVMFVTQGGGSSREILEIDSRFVTLTRNHEAVVALPRGMCNVFTLADNPSSGVPAFFAKWFSEVPWLRLGSESGPFVEAGGGISRGAAESLAGTIRQFMQENPPEAGYDDPLGALHLHYPDGAKREVRPTSAST